MKKYYLFTIVFALLSTVSFGQVGINTTSPDASAILEVDGTDGGMLIPRLTTAQRDAISNPANGLMIFNLDTGSIDVNTNTPSVPEWSELTTELSATPKVTGRIGSASSTVQGNSTFNVLPVGSADVTDIDSEYFTVLSDGTLEVTEAGSYLINASFSVQDLSAGDHKYILALFSGTSGTTQAQRLGYLARGFATQPSGTDYFGVSGTFQHYFNAGDTFRIMYWIDNGGTSMTGDRMHVGVTRL